MFVKIQDYALNDKHLVEAARIRWRKPNLLEAYVLYAKNQTVAGMSETKIVIEPTPSVSILVEDGDHVFIMNAEGKTIDSKTISLKKDAKK